MIDQADIDMAAWDTLVAARERYQVELDARVDGIKQDFDALCKIIAENTITLDRLMSEYDSETLDNWEVIKQFLEDEIREQIEWELNLG